MEVEIKLVVCKSFPTIAVEHWQQLDLFNLVKWKMKWLRYLPLILMQLKRALKRRTCILSLKSLRMQAKQGYLLYLSSSQLRLIQLNYKRLAEFWRERDKTEVVSWVNARKHIGLAAVVKCLISCCSWSSRISAFSVKLLSTVLIRWERKILCVEFCFIFEIFVWIRLGMIL